MILQWPKDCIIRTESTIPIIQKISLWKQALNRACPLISTCWITPKDESSRSTRSTHAARTNHSWQVFLTTVGFQRILYICLFFKWIHLFHKFHNSKDQQRIYYTLLITRFNQLFRNTLRQKNNKCNSPFFPSGKHTSQWRIPSRPCLKGGANLANFAGKPWLNGWQLMVDISD